MNKRRFSKEHVLITGGGDSVGRVMAEGFHSQGATVHICDVNEPALVKTLEANPGMRGTVADVGDSASVAQVFAETRLGDKPPISVLVNNVGIGGPHAGLEDISDEDWQQTMRVNVNGMFYCIKQAVAEMKTRQHGCIINFSSGSTRTCLPMRTPYVVSKYAVEGLTKNLARELGPFNIRCNAILPGVINNARMQGIVAASAEKEGISVEQKEAEYLNYISMRSKIEPQEIADMVLFLASQQARHISGQLIGVCGNLEWES